MKHEFRIMDTTGDTKIVWDPKNVDEVANARATFEDLLAKGFSAFSVTRTGAKNALITTFDPREAKIIFVPRMVGG